LHLYRVTNRLKSQLQFLHVLKDAKPQARRALLASADEELIKAIVECAINRLNWNHKLTIDEKGKLKKYKNRLQALVNPKISFKSKRKLLLQMVAFIFPLIASVVGCNRITTLTIKIVMQRMILVPPELWENRSQEPPPPVKVILKCKDHSNNKLTQVRLHQDPYLKTEKQKRDPIPIPIIETSCTNPSLTKILNGKA